MTHDTGQVILCFVMLIPMIITGLVFRKSRHKSVGYGELFTAAAFLLPAFALPVIFHRLPVFMHAPVRISGLVRVLTGSLMAYAWLFTGIGINRTRIELQVSWTSHETLDQFRKYGVREIPIFAIIITALYLWMKSESIVVMAFNAFFILIWVISLYFYNQIKKKAEFSRMPWICLLPAIIFAVLSALAEIHSFRFEWFARVSPLFALLFSVFYIIGLCSLGKRIAAEK